MTVGVVLPVRSARKRRVGDKMGCASELCVFWEIGKGALYIVLAMLVVLAIWCWKIKE